MKNKHRLLLLPMLLCAMWVTAQTHLVVQPLTGGEQQYSLAQIGKIKFVNDVMYLYDDAGTLLGSTPVAEVGKIVFGDQGEATAISETNDLSLKVFPNPAQETVVVRGLKGEQTIRIYNLQGQLMQSATTANGEAQLQVGSLQNGTYLLQAGAQVVKIIKE